MKKIIKVHFNQVMESLNIPDKLFYFLLKNSFRKGIDYADDFFYTTSIEKLRYILHIKDKNANHLLNDILQLFPNIFDKKHGYSMFPITLEQFKNEIYNKTKKEIENIDYHKDLDIKQNTKKELPIFNDCIVNIHGYLYVLYHETARFIRLMESVNLISRQSDEIKINGNTYVNILELVKYNKLRVCDFLRFYQSGYNYDIINENSHYYINERDLIYFYDNFVSLLSNDFGYLEHCRWVKRLTDYDFTELEKIDVSEWHRRQNHTKAFINLLGV